MRPRFTAQTAIAFAFSMSAITGTVACKRGDSGAILRGATQEELTQIDPNGQVAPIYADLGPEVRVGIFFSYDRVGGDMGFAPFGMRGNSPDPLAGPRADLAAQEFNRLEKWLREGLDGERPFLENVQVIEERRQGPPFAVKLDGTGPSLQQPGSGKSRWVIEMQVDHVQRLLSATGASLAANHITLLNGHFADPRLSKEQAQHFIEQYYGALLDAFRTQVASSPTRYIIGVFNGCGSEPIEDLLLPTVPPGKTLHIVANRKFSNYKYFASQIGGFFGLLSQGANWKDAIGAFRKVDPQHPEIVSMPVFRSATVDGPGQSREDRDSSPF